MSKNYIAEVAKMLGVELGEEFKLDKHNDIYKFTEEGLVYCLMGNLGWRTAPFTQNDLLTGKFEIKKLPWKPKENGYYYYVNWRRVGKKWVIKAFCTLFTDLAGTDNLRVAVGNCFRTYEEAEAQKYEVYKRLTGKDWSEVHG